MLEDQYPAGEFRLTDVDDEFRTERTESTFLLAALWPDSPPHFAPIAVPQELSIPVPADLDVLSGNVEAGDRLTQKLIEGRAATLAASAGVVESKISITLLNGRRCDAAMLKTNAGAPPKRKRPTAAEVHPSQLGQWIDILRELGVSADRHTSPDLIGQLYAALARPVDSILLNLLDVDPTACLNAALMAAESPAIRAGVDVIARLTGATQLWAAIDQNAPADWSRGFCKDSPSHATCKLVPLINPYPQNDPSLLVYALIDRRLRPKRSPVDVGAIVLDAAAAMAVGNVVLHGEPMLTVPIVVRDHARLQSHFRTVPVGTPIEALLHALGMPAAQWVKLRGGDVLRDVTLRSDAVVSDNELIVHAGLLEPPINPDPCVRCGWCFESCPTLVQPANCLEAAQRDDHALAVRYGIDGCIECGICSYVCPSRLPILAGIRQLRARH